MKNVLKIAGILVLCLMTTSMAFAQQEATTGEKSDLKVDQSPGGIGSRNASDILDKKIVDQQGKELGKVDDFVLDEKGQIEAVILSKGGVLGIGEEKYTIAWDKIQLQTGDKEQLVAAVQEGDLENYQAKKNEQPNGQRVPVERPAGQEQAVQGKESMSPESSATAKAEVDKPAGQDQAEKPAGQDSAGMEKKTETSGIAARDERSLDQVKNWIGKTVSGKDGEQLGTVNNLFIGSEGQVRYVLVSGEDKKLHPVPIDLVSQKKDGEGLQAEFSKDVFQNSISFAQSEAPNLEGSDWEAKIRGFYNEKGTGKSQESGMKGMQSPERMKEMHNQMGEMKENQSRQGAMEKKQQ